MGLETILTLGVAAGILALSVVIRLLVMVPYRISMRLAGYPARRERAERRAAELELRPSIFSRVGPSLRSGAGRVMENVIAPLAIFIAAVAARAAGITWAGARRAGSWASITTRRIGTAAFVWAEATGDRAFGAIHRAMAIDPVRFSFLSPSSIAEDALWRTVRADIDSHGYDPVPLELVDTTPIPIFESARVPSRLRPI